VSTVTEFYDDEGRRMLIAINPPGAGHIASYEDIQGTSDGVSRISDGDAMNEPMKMNVKRVRVEIELDDGTIKAVEYTKIREVSLDVTREPRETTWEQVMPTHRTFAPGPLIELNLHVMAEAATVSVPEATA
jgi:hypothetical protein